MSELDTGPMQDPLSSPTYGHSKEGSSHSVEQAQSDASNAQASTRGLHLDGPSDMTSSKPLPISTLPPRHIGEHGDHDPEATPVAASAFPRHPTTPTASTSRSQPVGKPVAISALRAKVCRAAALGDLQALLVLLHPEEHGYHDPLDLEDYPSSFALVNSPTTSGLTPLLEAAQHGHLHVVQHLLEEEGAVRDLEDIEGENAFLKASYRGHLDIMKYLGDGEDGTSLNSADREGWTALHNAAGKGYLEVVMWLVEHGACVNSQSRQGYTPLMNAASKGQLPIVRYLLSRHSPNPFARNAYNETAYDVAVATFELGIAEILANFECTVWDEQYAHSGGPFKPLALHINVPVIFYENQRLDLRWYTRAKRTLTQAAQQAGASIPGSLQRDQLPRFTSSALSRRDRHASYELQTASLGLEGSKAFVPMRRTDVRLPFLSAPTAMPVPQRPATGRTSSNSSIASSALSPVQKSPSNQGESAWYWLSDAFFVDLSPSYVDPDQGWQYATSFEAPDSQWTAEVPEPLAELLTGSIDAASESGSKQKWVRRRRWTRVMRRRLDVPDWGFADMTPSSEKGDVRASYASELKAWPTASGSSKTIEQQREAEASELRDYLERAKYFAGTHLGKYARKRQISFNEFSEKTLQSESPSKTVEEDNDDARSVISSRTIIEGGTDTGNLDRASGRRIIARLERAIDELQTGMDTDSNEGRKSDAFDLLQVYEARVKAFTEKFPAVASAPGDEEESFHYPGATDTGEEDDDTASISTSLRSASIYSPRASSPGTLASPPPASLEAHLATFGQAPSPGRPNLASIAQQLSSNPDFRVPTNETPRKVVPAVIPSYESALSGAQVSGRQRSSLPWEPDDAAHDCRRCHRRFTFFLRKHHCRKCGLVVCAQCSGQQDFLTYSEVIQEPGMGDPWVNMGIFEGGGLYRVCDTCHESLTLPAFATSPAIAFDLAVSPTNVQLAVPMARTSSGSSLEDPAVSPMQRSMSDLSELGECPVCGTDLASIGDKGEQECHIQQCLESGGSARLQDNRYLVFALPETSPLVGTDCLICFESYECGDQIGRLNCLCHFHKHCISNWLSRGKACPVHAR